uniref:V-type proton ATPase subunit G n=1 Tax=Catharus ustulatus TaxID=91951 RepID=A0A8C3TQX0_CATUS
MTSQSQGIQQLLQAEKRAKDKLEEAKKRKGKRLRQAKEEATAEIDHYRLQREKEFRNKETNVRNSKPDCFQEYYMETPANHSYHKNMESMMKKLLSTICDISPEIHPNFRPSDGRHR